jgi:hypothetical protein
VIYPEWRGDDYIMVGDEIVVIDPRTHEIVGILEAYPRGPTLRNGRSGVFRSFATDPSPPLPAMTNEAAGCFEHLDRGPDPWLSV